MPTSLLVQSTAASCRSGDDAVPLPSLASRRSATLAAIGKECSLYLPLWAGVPPPLEGIPQPNPFTTACAMEVP